MTDKEWEPCFIINAHAGLGFGKWILERLKKECKKEKIRFRIYHTHKPGEETELTKKAIDANYSPIIAVGGDGTVSKVGLALAGTKVPLGIIPAGTGNGLAIEMGMPIDAILAYRALKKAGEIDIDIGIVNNRTFINIFGIGLDAVIVSEFSKFKGIERNFFQYVAETLKQFSQSEGFEANVSGISFPENRKHISIMLVNNRRLGGAAVIAPWASLYDGFLDLISIPKLAFHEGIQEMVRLITSTLNKSNSLLNFSVKEGVIITEKPLRYQIDGETMPDKKNEFIFDVKKRCLRILRCK
ncbi:MAG: YegS/Rv2252/BmrU family lipid kinase [Candidatus Coatesbacteria bacterium]|nr:YegS/Rv2252/BmrU family lipid kinase [Candidatus Coatesbacteria bacterium]